MSDVEADVVVVGFGGAGACAAIEAAQQGASVIVLDRFTGGGATALSGGVYYAGGGTEHQRVAGFNDTPDAMFHYLQKELNGVVSDDTLRRFCDGSNADLRWLEDLGVEFEGSYCPFKTSYPTDDYYLYYSGNEAIEPYASIAPPAPRGHRVKAPGMSGAALYQRLRDAVFKTGIEVRRHTRAVGLMRENGNVTGVECQAIPAGSIAARVHSLLYTLHKKTIIYVPPIGRFIAALMKAVESTFEKPVRIHARNGVILATGGFIMNRAMIAEHAPHGLAGLPLGTAGDDGSGIGIAQQAGGATSRLNKVTAWRFYNPPVGFVRGVLVDKQGARICNEAMYGAVIGTKMIEEHGGEAYLILDDAAWRAAWNDVFNQTVFFQRLQAFYIFSIGHKKAGTLDALARKTGIDPTGLKITIETYNGTEHDPLGKPDDYVHPIQQPPYYAVNCSLNTPHAFPCPVLTLGGVQVDETSGRVKREDGSAIDGLYAVGRAAIGICSEGYLSGLSIADCVFSGRRAGRHAAQSRH